MEDGSGPLVGPIQLVVIGFPRDAQFRGQILRALSEVRGHGVIRLIDALFVRKDDQGRISGMMRESDLTQVQRELLGGVAGSLARPRPNTTATAGVPTTTASRPSMAAVKHRRRPCNQVQGTPPQTPVRQSLSPSRHVVCGPA
jgi:hypothetical protein